ncbi:MAG: hypothetical protein J2P37_33725, partial [Ktedonobacteraceae bacterium]|nr:hypothetical protein [Ktedonobacteraceae bacterium]
LSTRARKKITSFSKGLSEILAGAAEPVMRYATIYLMIATGIPFLRVEAIYWACIAIVIVAPEFVLLGALAIGENAYKAGSRAWAKVLFVVCALLAIIMIATFVDIFIIPFDAMAIKILNFCRCLVAVGFSFTLNKLEAEADREAPTIDTLDGLKASLLAQIRAEMPAPQQIDVTALAQQIITEVQASIPNAHPSIDYHQLAATVAPMIEAGLTSTLHSELKATLASVSHPQVVASEPPEKATREEQKTTSNAGSRATRKLVSEPPRATAEASEKGAPEERLEAAYQDLVDSGKEPTGRALAGLAKVGRARAGEWLEARARATHKAGSQSHSSGVQSHQDTDELLASILDGKPDAA